MAFVTEQDDVGDGVVEHWTILDGASPWVTMVQLIQRDSLLSCQTAQ